MRDRGNAVLDRLIIIPFNAVFDKRDPDYDPFLKYKVVEQKSGKGGHGDHVMGCTLAQLVLLSTNIQLT